MASLPLLLLVLLAASPAEKSADTTRDLDVWLIPHSHCDTGWIETVDGYYNSSVKLILSTVTAHLDADPSARFIWSETLWLSMWWPQQTAPVQAAFRRIVERGQFEFVGAGWSQNDETTTHFRDVIDNQIIGHQWLQDTFGQQQGRTRWGWQIDMFAGYASTTPALWAMMEYDGMVIRWEGRDEAMQYAWTLAKDYQFHWHPSAVLSANRSSIFTHIINGNYGDLVPSNSYIAGYGCDANVVATGKCCADGPPSCEIVSAVNVSNVATVARTLVAQLRGKALPYRGPLMYPWGADFHFREAGHTFGNMSLVLAEIAAHPETYHTTVRLSTLSEYMDHLHSFELKFPEKNVTEASFEWGWPKVVHEHGLYPFNYSNESTQFQTGALTSQSVHKQHSRRVAVHTHAASAAHAVATAAAQHALNSTESRALLGKLVVARGALGICQHHDSMPGTMEPAVLADYTVRLNAASTAVESVLQQSLQVLGGSAAATASATLNHSVVVFNPLVHDRTSVLNTTLPSISAHGWSVVADDGPVAAQYDALDPRVVHFVASVPALGYANFDFVPCSSSGCGKVAVPVQADGALPIKNAALSLGFDGGLLATVLNIASVVKAQIVQELAAYVNGVGGAYILIETQEATLLPSPVHVRTITGPVLSEVVQAYNSSGVASSLRQRIRLYSFGQTDTIEVTQMIGNGDGRRNVRELITRYRTDLKATALHTDSTGFETHERAWDPRGIGANYHAMTQRASLVEAGASGAESRQVSLLTTHTMGVASLADGRIEHMLVRRLNTTDNQGPAPLNELGSLNVTTQLLFDSAAKLARKTLRRALEQEHPLIVLPAVAPERRAFAPLAAGSEEIVVHLDAHLVGLSVRWGGTIGAWRTPAANSTASLVLRWMNTANSRPAIPVPLTQLVQALTGVEASRVRCTELTLTMVDSRAHAEARRMRWDPAEHPAAAAGAGVATGAGAAAVRREEGGCGPAVVEPMDMRTYEFTWTPAV